MNSTEFGAGAVMLVIVLAILVESISYARTRAAERAYLLRINTKREVVLPSDQDAISKWDSEFSQRQRAARYAAHPHAMQALDTTKALVSKAATAVKNRDGGRYMIDEDVAFLVVVGTLAYWLGCMLGQSEARKK